MLTWAVVGSAALVYAVAIQLIARRFATALRIWGTAPRVPIPCCQPLRFLRLTPANPHPTPSSADLPAPRSTSTRRSSCLLICSQPILRLTIPCSIEHWPPLFLALTQLCVGTCVIGLISLCSYGVTLLPFNTSQLMTYASLSGHLLRACIQETSA